ncbi:alpha/beta hydrolase [Arthrobacter sp. AETb3-4]|uniref:Alpha/beta hydrolase n=2 Tax=Arthrobacter wenxiniae TaxID=2713570 RepID=A0A7Y7IG05_9MICC|nr:alpha/beta hydrolase [Arthrobacter wenxiniae]
MSLDVDGAKVTCHLGGADREDLDPVVLIHGIGGSTAADFGFIFPMLARHGRVMSVDFCLPALGEHETLRLEHVARQVRVAIDEVLPGRQVSMVGYSLGAVIAAAVAASHPAPGRLVLVSGWLKAGASHRIFNDLWQRLRILGPTVLSRFARFSALGTSFLNSSPLEELEAMSPFSPGLFTDAQIRLAATVDLSETAARICIPTLVIGCSNDTIAGREQAEALVGAIPDASYAEVESGHAVVLERPAELFSLIDGFLSRPQRQLSGSNRQEAGA